MFITLKFTDYEEQIPMSNILKFTKIHNSEVYKITLSEIETPELSFWSWGYVKIRNKIVSVSLQSQPLAFEQIKQYLASQ